MWVLIGCSGIMYIYLYKVMRLYLKNNKINNTNIVAVVAAETAYNAYVERAVKLLIYTRYL